MPSKVLPFPGHAAASDLGYRSGRSSDRETPVTCSIASTYSAATPFLARLSQNQTWPCVVPMRSANLFWLPAMAHARSRARLVDMNQVYRESCKWQQENGSGTANLKSCKSVVMRPIDKIAFGKRVFARRKALGLSQSELAEAVGMKQQTLGNIELGKTERPRLMLELAEALATTERWLLWEEGLQLALPQNPQEIIAAALQELKPEQMAVAARFLKTLAEKKSEAA